MTAPLTSLLTASESLGEAYATGLLEAVVALLLVAGLAYLSLRFAGGRGLFGGRNKQLAIEESLRLDGKSALLVVRVEGRRLLLATHPHAAPTLLTELDAAQAEPNSAADASTDEPISLPRPKLVRAESGEP